MKGKKSAEKIKRTEKAPRAEKVKELTKEVLKKSKLPEEFLGMTSSMIEGIYGQAYRLYNTGKYRDASQLFRLLITVNPTEYKFAMGLGACLHMMKNYLGAAETYGLCTLIDPKNPIPDFHASDCHMHLKNKTAAIQDLETAIKKAGDQEMYQTLKERAAFNIKSLSKKEEKK